MNNSSVAVMLLLAAAADGNKSVLGYTQTGVSQGAK